MMKNKNNKNGFTLIEILLVISLVSILSIAGAIGLNTIKSKSIKTSQNDIVENIKVATEVYLNQNSTIREDIYQGNNKCIKIYTLQYEGLLDTELTDPSTSKRIPGNICVNVCYDYDNLTLNYEFDYFE